MKDLPADQRPREKLQARGPAALADAELLAVLLRTGYKGCGVLTLAQQVLDQCRGFAGLLNAEPDKLKAIKGLGPAKRAELLAVMETARRALTLNAGAVVLAHNHPSGVAEPSRADEYLTQTLKTALQLIDVRVLDHIIVGQGQVVSMAERGLL